MPLSARTATVGLFIPRGVRANMVDQDNVWYRLGYALERVRERLPRADRLRALEERQRSIQVLMPLFHIAG